MKQDFNKIELYSSPKLQVHQLADSARSNNTISFEISYQAENLRLVITHLPSFSVALINSKGDEIFASQPDCKLNIEDLELWVVIEVLIIWGGYLAGIELKRVPLDKDMAWELIENEEEQIDLFVVDECMQVKGLTGRFFDVLTDDFGDGLYNDTTRGYQVLSAIQLLRMRLSPQVNNIAIIRHKLAPPQIREYYELITSNSLLQQYFYPYSSKFKPENFLSITDLSPSMAIGG
ncbi:hypothetical protein [Hydrogenovibrio marinus]|uniref:Uncharacterized protein n=1 Tax=Hydrogenovibrio marinus TaxID=28885 RepID=A0A066ZRZ7_HYDMR|nr:hypothetical protein [Hydrogenovibrio marinus]KDN96583.1 hypothetical protein EI16_10035 [Hydrogenovibrio marinus]BBN60207.1 hypothetical protein HVMH_1801 [Hydrogenovibrio marinus]